VIVFLAVCAGVGALSSVLRLAIAYLDYCHRWKRLPVEFFGRKRSR
jgi:hypothetical protein